MGRKSLGEDADSMGLIKLRYLGPCMPTGSVVVVRVGFEHVVLDAVGGDLVEVRLCYRSNSINSTCWHPRTITL